MIRPPISRQRSLALFILLVLLIVSLNWLNAQDNPRPQGGIEGLVRGADGKPDPALIHLQQYMLGRHSASLHADEQGKFGVRELPLGRYWLTIRGVLVDDIEITPSRPNAKVALQAPPWSIVRGVVREKKTGKPVGGAIVMANLYSEIPFTFKSRDLSHRFEWAGRPIEKLMERAADEKKPFAVTNGAGQYELKVGDEVGEFIAVAPHALLYPASRELAEPVRGVKELDFALDDAERFRIRGQVTLDNGAPFTKGKIRFLTRLHPHYFFDLTTDEQGNYSFLPTNFLTHTAWLEVDGYSIMHQFVPLDKEPPYPPVDWVLKRSQKGTLKVTAKRADGKPMLDGAEITGWRDGAQPDAPKKGTPGPHIFYRAESENWGLAGVYVRLKDGKGQSDMEPGAYAVSLALQPLTDVHADARTNLKTYFTREPDQTRFTITPGMTTDLALVTPRASAVTVQVTDKAGTPVPGINLAVFRWHEATYRYSGSWSSTRTNAKGEVLYDPVAPGRYVFHPSAGSTDFEPLHRYPIELKEGVHAKIKMVLTNAEIDQLKPPENRYDLKIPGQVFMPDGVTPAAFAAVYHELGGSHGLDDVEPQARADAEGKFVLTNRTTGSLLVGARSHGTALTSIRCKLGRDDHAPIRIVLKQAATLHGRVLNDDGSPTSDVRLWLGPPSLSQPRSWGDPYGNGSVSLTTPVRRDGTFTLHGVAPGKHALCMYRDGRLHVQRIVPLDIEEGERRDVKLTIPPNRPGLELHFKRADGKPMPKYYEANLCTDIGPLRSGLEPNGDRARSYGPLPPGRYHLVLTPGSWVKPNENSLPNLIVRTIEVKPGKDVQRETITIPAAGAIQGRVVVPDGTPAAALTVAVHVESVQRYFIGAPLSLVLDPQGPASYTETSIAPDGTYALHGLMPGSYRLSVRWRGRAEQIFVSEVLEVKAGATTAAGTWTIGTK